MSLYSVSQYLSIFHFCFRYVFNLKRHLMSKLHSWSSEKAEAARNNFGLSKEKAHLPEDVRHSKVRHYARRICPLNHCFKEVKRLGNHLRQFHKLSNEKTRKYVARSIMALAEEKEEISEDDSDSSESDEERLLESNFTNEIYKPEGDTFIYDSGEEDDHDWLGEKFFQRHTHKAKGNKDCLSESDESDDENGGEDDKSVEGSDSDSEDYEDHEERFCLSSKEEDELCDEFIAWLCSTDGGLKPKRTAMKHKAVVSQIVRYEENVRPDYKNLYNRAFLNNWMAHMQAEGRQAGTIKTYLGSILHFLNFVCISEKNSFDLQQIKKIEAIIRQWRRNLWKDIKKREHEKMTIDIAHFPLPEEIEAMDNSVHTKSAIATLKRYICTSSKIIKRISV